MSHLMSAQRGKSTWRVISALDCPLTSALLHVEFHVILAHEDSSRSTNCWNVDRRHSERGKFHPNRRRKILLGGLVYATLYVVLQSKVCSWVDKLAIDKFNGRALDSEYVVGPAMTLISESMMVGCVVPTAASSSFRPSEFCLPVAGNLQAHEHETSRVVMLIDNTSGQLIADLIAIGRR